MTNYGAFIFNGSIPLWINQGFEGVHNIFAYDLLYYFRITEKYILNLYFSSTTYFPLQNQAFCLHNLWNWYSGIPNSLRERLVESQ